MLSVLSLNNRKTVTDKLNSNWNDIREQKAEIICDALTKLACTPILYNWTDATAWNKELDMDTKLSTERHTHSSPMLISLCCWSP